MGGFRIAFKVKGEFIFAILADSSASLLFINSRLVSIVDVFEEFLENNDVEDYEEIQSAEFDSKIDSIITGEDELIGSQTLFKKIIDFIKKLILENDILGATIFTINGKVIFTSLPHNILLSSLKELEIRHMVANEFRLTFVCLDNGQKVFTRKINIPWKLDPLLIVVLFESSVPLGMAELNLDKLVKTIENIL